MLLITISKKHIQCLKVLYCRSHATYFS
jgi:hypothetical protein